MKIRALIILLTAIVILQGPAAVLGADIGRMGGGARSIALGKAYVADTGDPGSMFVNPAGLSAIATFEISSMYVNFAEDVSYTMLGAAYPTGYGVFAVGYLGAFSGDLALTTEESTGRIAPAGVFNYSSNIFSLSYAAVPLDKLSVGATAKYMIKGSPQVDGGMGSGMSADIGAVYKINDLIRLGVSARNILSTGMKWDGGLTETVPSEIAAGLAITPDKRFTVMVETEKTGSGGMLLKGGAEYELRKGLSLRCGGEQMQSGPGSTYWNYSGGVGFETGQMRIDYAYYRDSLVTENSSHFISLSLAFPGVAALPAERVPEVVTEEVLSSGQTTPEQSPVQIVKAEVPTEYDKSAVAVEEDRLTEQRVREYINLLDRKIESYRKQKNARKVREIQAEKQRTLKRWQAEKRTEHSAPAPVKPEDRSASELTEQRVREYINLLDRKIESYRKQKNAQKVREIQAEKQRTLKRWQAEKRTEHSAPAPVKPEDRSAPELTEQRVREYINLLDRKIESYRKQKNARKIREIQAEKQRTLKRWQEYKLRTED